MQSATSRGTYAVPAVAASSRRSLRAAEVLCPGCAAGACASDGICSRCADGSQPATDGLCDDTGAFRPYARHLSAQSSGRTHAPSALLTAVMRMSSAADRVSLFLAQDSGALSRLEAAASPPFPPINGFRFHSYFQDGMVSDSLGSLTVYLAPMRVSHMHSSDAGFAYACICLNI